MMRPNREKGHLNGNPGAVEGYLTSSLLTEDALAIPRTPQRELALRIDM